MGREKQQFAAFLTACLVFAPAVPALALDKQGSAHEGHLPDSTDTSTNLSGAVTLGTALYNKTYAARPDNTGLALLRYAIHADLDLYGPRFSIPIDVNFFTDRLRRGGKVTLPTEFDLITGVTSTHNIGAGALEIGARVEHDRPIDEGSFSQTYLDLRARYLFSLASVSPKLGRALADGDVSGFFTLGVFAYNPTYAARPDNSGLALFRYGAHVELSILADHVSFGFDSTFFTDRTVQAFRPSELDFTSEIIFRKAPFEAHLAYERDMPIDSAGKGSLAGC